MPLARLSVTPERSSMLAFFRYACCASDCIRSRLCKQPLLLSNPPGKPAGGWAAAAVVSAARRLPRAATHYSTRRPRRRAFAFAAGAINSFLCNGAPESPLKHPTASASASSSSAASTSGSTPAFYTSGSAPAYSADDFSNASASTEPVLRSEPGKGQRRRSYWPHACLCVRLHECACVIARA